MITNTTPIHVYWRTVASIALTAALLGLAAPIPVGAAHAPSFSQIGPEGGSIVSLARDAADPDRIYAATGTSRMFRSQDGGTSWTRLPDPFPEEVQLLMSDPQAPLILYAGLQGGGVWRSGDGAETWEERSAGLETIGALPSIRSLEIDPTDGDVLYAATSFTFNASVFKSVDGGLNWLPTALDTVFVLSLELDPGDASILYAGTRSGEVYKTTDGGDSWNPTGPLPGSSSATRVLDLLVDPVSSSIVYAATSIGAFRSTDGGATWQARNTGLIVSTASGDRPLQGFRLWIDPSDSQHLLLGTGPPDVPETVLGGEGGLYETVDAGNGWNALSGVEGGFGVPTVLEISPDTAQPGALLVGTLSSGIWATGDGGSTWVPRNTGLVARRIRTLAAHPGDSQVVYVGTASSGFYKTTDGGATWAALSPSMGHPVVNLASYRDTLLTGLADYTSIVIHPSAPETVYAAVPGDKVVGAGVRKSIDGGQSWSSVNNGLSTFGAGHPIRELDVDPNDASTLYAVGSELFTGASVFKTSDAGGSWAHADSGLFAPGDSLISFAGLSIDPVQPDVLYAGKSLDGTFRSADGGASWSMSSEFEPDCLIASKLEGSTLYAVAALDEFHESVDGAFTFQEIPPGLPAGGPCSGLFEEPVSVDHPDAFYASNPGETYASHDAGATWALVETLPSDALAMASASGDQDAIYAGTRQDGVFVLPEPDRVVLLSLGALASAGFAVRRRGRMSQERADG